MAEALEDGVVVNSHASARYRRQMRLNVERLSGMVDDLFELSRLQAGTLRLALSSRPGPGFGRLALASSMVVYGRAPMPAPRRGR